MTMCRGFFEVPNCTSHHRQRKASIIPPCAEVPKVSIPRPRRSALPCAEVPTFGRGGMGGIFESRQWHIGRRSKRVGGKASAFKFGSPGSVQCLPIAAVDRRQSTANGSDTRCEASSFAPLRPVAIQTVWHRPENLNDFARAVAFQPTKSKGARPGPFPPRPRKVLEEHRPTSAVDWSPYSLGPDDFAQLRARTKPREFSGENAANPFRETSDRASEADNSASFDESDGRTIEFRESRPPACLRATFSRRRRRYDPTASAGARRAFASAPREAVLTFTIARRRDGYPWTVRSGDGAIIATGSAPTRAKAVAHVRRLWPDARLDDRRKLQRVWREV